jgi:hypothetical protein
MYASASAGDYLLNQFLLFNVFLLVKKRLSSFAWKRDWMVLLHNLGCGGGVGAGVFDVFYHRTSEVGGCRLVEWGGHWRDFADSPF